MKRKTAPFLVLTPGDPAGIGPEITWKAIRALAKGSQKTPPILCVGAQAPFQKLKAPIVPYEPGVLPPKSSKPFVWLWSAPETPPQGKLLEGFQSGWSIEKATDLVLSGHASALVTGPIHKERLQKGGYLYPGHTEFLAELCSPGRSSGKPTGLIPPVTMMLANETLRVSLVTTHVALKDVSTALSRSKLRKTILQTVEGLQKFWKIKKPKIAVLALNPHGGELGLFGREEIEVIDPEIRALQQSFPTPSYRVEGPFPADTFFAKHVLAKAEDRSEDLYDAVVCMYHDQGLIPVKLLDFHHTVNVTLGLPMVRTSVDHGVGFDIAGKGIADPSSLRAAIDLAIHFVQKKA